MSAEICRSGGGIICYAKRSGLRYCNVGPYGVVVLIRSCVVVCTIIKDDSDGTSGQ